MEASRRWFLFSAAAAACAAENPAKGRVLPSVAVRYLDPATEFVITRLTDPQFSSYLLATGNRVVTSRGLLYASDATGKGKRSAWTSRPENRGSSPTRAT